MSFFSWLASFFRRKPYVADSLPQILVPAMKPGKVLLAGINAYPDAPLSGCVNDERDLKEVALGRYGYEDRAVLMLLNEGARTDSLVEGIKWLCKDVKAGQTVLFAYSGHGAQVPNPDESDGLSEVICPQDFDWSPEHMLTDKQLVELFSALPSGVRFNWLSDSCHSGDLDRELPRPGHKNAPRQMRLPASLALAVQSRVRARGHARGVRALLGGSLDVGYVSGCRSNQTSADTEVNGRPCGAFTHYFLEALKTFPDDAPLFKIAQDAARRLAVAGYSQEPLSDGRQANMPFQR